MQENDNKVTLDNQEITMEQLNEQMANLKTGERIIEVAPGKYEKVSRLFG